MAVKQVKIREIIDQFFYANVSWVDIPLYFGSSELNSSEYFIKISYSYKESIFVVAGVVDNEDYMTMVEYDTSKPDWRNSMYDFIVDFVKWVKHSPVCGRLFSDLDDYRIRCNQVFFANATVYNGDEE